MFSVAKMGMPAVTVPTIGTSISSREEPSELPLSLSEKISIALGFAGSLLIYPTLIFQTAFERVFPYTFAPYSNLFNNNNI